MLKNNPSPKLKVLLVWMPVLGNDSLSRAKQSSGYLQDPRVSQFWDLWSFSSRIFEPVLKWPTATAGPVWDTFLLFDGTARWTNYAGPAPLVWMQNLGIEFGVKYDPVRLESAIKQLTR
ncbi:MAG: hypothetical protein ACR2L2_03410 [Acidobacteriota bacterium]